MLRVIVSVLLLSSASVAASQSSKPAGERATDPRNKMICKRFTETGSLVGQKRVCKTKAEWERDRDLMRQSMAGGAGCGDLSKCR